MADINLSSKRMIYALSLLAFSLNLLVAGSARAEEFESRRSLARLYVDPNIVVSTFYETREGESFPSAYLIVYVVPKTCMAGYEQLNEIFSGFSIDEKTKVETRDMFVRAPEMGSSCGGLSPRRTKVYIQTGIGEASPKVTRLHLASGPISAMLISSYTTYNKELQRWNPPTFKFDYESAE